MAESMALETRREIPTANRCWKPEEDELLRKAVAKYGPGKWALAAQSVPGRSNHQLRQRWMFYLDPSINKQPLTDHEYMTILTEQFRIGNKWMDIASLLPGRTYCFISDTWYNSIRRKVVRYLAEKRGIGKLQVPCSADGRFDYREGELEGSLQFVLSKVNRSKTKLQRWADAEDKLLKQAVENFGLEWVKVASAVPGRTNRQCRLRWANHLDPRVNKLALTDSEMRILVERHSKLGNKWADIVKYLPGRTDEFIKYNWCNKIFGKIVSYLTKKRGIDKKQLQCTNAGCFDYQKGELEGAISFVVVSVQKGLRKRSRATSDEEDDSNSDSANTPEAKRGAFFDEEVGEFRISPVAVVDALGLDKGKRVHKPWTANEDNVLRHCVEKFGDDWSLVASYVAGRSKQQCSYRWTNHLEPSVKKDKFTRHEYRIFLEVHSKIGNKWTDIAKLLPGRTSSCIANFWNSSVKRNVVEYLAKKRSVDDSDILFEEDGRILYQGQELEGVIHFVVAYTNTTAPKTPTAASSETAQLPDENASLSLSNVATASSSNRSDTPTSLVQWSLKSKVDDAAIQLLRMRQGEQCPALSNP